MSYFRFLICFSFTIVINVLLLFHLVTQTLVYFFFDYSNGIDTKQQLIIWLLTSCTLFRFSSSSPFVLFLQPRKLKILLFSFRSFFFLIFHGISNRLEVQHTFYFRLCLFFIWITVLCVVWLFSTWNCTISWND